MRFIRELFVGVVFLAWSALAMGQAQEAPYEDYYQSSAVCEYLSVFSLVLDLDGLDDEECASLVLDLDADGGLYVFEVVDDDYLTYIGRGLDADGNLYSVESEAFNMAISNSKAGVNYSHKFSFELIENDEKKKWIILEP